jgi:hypothetical protein
MQYLLLIYGNEKAQADASPEKEKEIMAQWFTYTNDLKASGALLGGNALQRTSTATSMRIRDGKRLVTDGPFAETKEQLGGYYLIEAKNLDEALEWAARCPGATGGTLEVRPIMVFD